ncbi:MAG TPA: cyclic nucleotide-binding domain-containing protein [Acidobacteriota bacterium]|jgi:CRP-like cAMP-binding protein
MKRWLTVALLLTLLALGMGLQFELNTTGGTLFVFATFAPVLVILSIAIIAGALFHEFRQQHRLFEYERYSPGDVIVRQGDLGDCAYFIRSGEVEVVRQRDGESDEAVVARLGKGEYFGETALLTNEPRNATIRAVTEAEVAALGKRNFLALVSVLPATQEDILKTVRQRAMKKAK